MAYPTAGLDNARSDHSDAMDEVDSSKVVVSSFDG
jgi:hypothetical protein